MEILEIILYNVLLFGSIILFHKFLMKAVQHVMDKENE